MLKQELWLQRFRAGLWRKIFRGIIGTLNALTAEAVIRGAIQKIRDRENLNEKAIQRFNTNYP